MLATEANLWESICQKEHHVCSFPALCVEHLAAQIHFRNPQTTEVSVNSFVLLVWTYLYTYLRQRMAWWHNSQFLAQANDTHVVNR